MGLSQALLIPWSAITALTALWDSGGVWCWEDGGQRIWEA